MSYYPRSGGYNRDPYGRERPHSARGGHYMVDDRRGGYTDRRDRMSNPREYGRQEPRRDYHHQQGRGYGGGMTEREEHRHRDLSRSYERGPADRRRSGYNHQQRGGFNQRREEVRTRAAPQQGYDRRREQVDDRTWSFRDPVSASRGDWSERRQPRPSQQQGQSRVYKNQGQSRIRPNQAARSLGRNERQPANPYQNQQQSRVIQSRSPNQRRPQPRTVRTTRQESLVEEEEEEFKPKWIRVNGTWQMQDNSTSDRIKARKALEPKVEEESEEEDYDDGRPKPFVPKYKNPWNPDYNLEELRKQDPSTLTLEERRFLRANWSQSKKNKEIGKHIYKNVKRGTGMSIQKGISMAMGGFGGFF